MMGVGDLSRIYDVFNTGITAGLGLFAQIAAFNTLIEACIIIEGEWMLTSRGVSNIIGIDMERFCHDNFEMTVVLIFDFDLYNF